MEAILILAGPYSSCNATQIIWEEQCNNKNIELKIFDLTHKDGQELSSKLNIKSFPALVINNKVVAVGHPDKQTAQKVIQALE